MRRRNRLEFGLTFLLFWMGMSRLLLAADAAAPGLHDRLIAEYLAGKWDDLSTELTSSAKEIATLAPAEKADVDYIRKTIAESRPAWWKITKAGDKVRFRPAVWGHTLSATFDPSGKTNVQVNYVNSVPSVTLMWDVKDMDNPAEAEHGFTKGELNDLSVWSTLGTAQSWTDLSLRSQSNLDDAGKMLLTRYLGFRGIVTSNYYGIPRARRWGFWLGMHAYNAEHDKDPTAMCRRAIGALFIAEVLSHPKTYPSVKFPSEIPPEETESKLTPRLKDLLGKTGFTFSEDMALREAIKTFATTNENKTRVSGIVNFPNGLTLSLDPSADKPLSAKRDAWIRSAISGAK